MKNSKKFSIYNSQLMIELFLPIKSKNLRMHGLAKKDRPEDQEEIVQIMLNY